MGNRVNRANKQTTDLILVFFIRFRQLLKIGVGTGQTTRISANDVKGRMCFTIIIQLLKKTSDKGTLQFIQLLVLKKELTQLNTFLLSLGLKGHLRNLPERFGVGLRCTSGSSGNSSELERVFSQGRVSLNRVQLLNTSLVIVNAESLSSKVLFISFKERFLHQLCLLFNICGFTYRSISKDKLCKLGRGRGVKLTPGDFVHLILKLFKVFVDVHIHLLQLFYIDSNTSLFHLEKHKHERDIHSVVNLVHVFNFKKFLESEVKLPSIESIGKCVRCADFNKGQVKSGSFVGLETILLLNVFCDGIHNIGEVSLVNSKEHLGVLFQTIRGVLITQPRCNHGIKHITGLYKDSETGNDMEVELHNINCRLYLDIPCLQEFVCSYSKDMSPSFK